MSEKYYQVNWDDGMKLGKEHFIALDNYVNERLKDSLAVRMRSHDFGLLPDSTGQPSYNVSIDIDRNNLLRVKLLDLHAVTPSGIRIDISQNQKTLTNTDFDKQLDIKNMQSKTMYVVLSVNPYGRIPMGEHDPQEARLPFVDFDYAVNVVKPEDVFIPFGSHHHLCLGRIEVRGNACQLVEEYIPPCAAIPGHSDLLDIYNQLDNVISKMEANSVAIIQKIYKKDQTNDLSKSVLYLVENIAQYFSMNITRYRWVTGQEPPIYMFDFFASLARLVKNTIDQKSGAGREQLLTYFKDWIVEVNQGEFEQVVNELINLQYNHNDLMTSLNALQSFTITLSLVLSKLAKLDYIGDKKSTGIIVTAEEAQAIPVKKSRKFLME